jgi:hypothetical protein
MGGSTFSGAAIAFHHPSASLDQNPEQSPRQ